MTSPEKVVSIRPTQFRQTRLTFPTASPAQSTNSEMTEDDQSNVLDTSPNFDASSSARALNDKQSKKNRYFNKAWTDQYFFVPTGKTMTCLECAKQIRSIKEYAVQNHYQKHHPELAVMNESDRKVHLRLRLSQNHMEEASEEQENTRVEDAFANRLAMTNHCSYSDCVFITDILLDFVSIKCPSLLPSVKSLSLSRIYDKARQADL